MNITDHRFCEQLSNLAKRTVEQEDSLFLIKVADRMRALSQLCWSLGGITSFESIPTLKTEELCQKNEK